MYAADTSVAVPAIDVRHEHHELAERVVLERTPVLAGHAAFEAFSVITRRPMPARLSPIAAAEILRENFGQPCWLSTEGAARVFALVAEANLAGGAIYDALVAQAALDNNRTLLTLDRRARRVYDAVGVDYELLR